MSRRIVVSGSRDWPYPSVIVDVLDRQLAEAGTLIVVHGDASSGADRLARDWARIHLYAEDEPHPAKWNVHAADCAPYHSPTESRCRGAGIRRNHEMVDLGANLLIAFRHNHSRGTTDTIEYAATRKLPTLTYDVFT